MKLCLIEILSFLLVFSVSSQATVLFWDNFEDGVMSDKWKVVTEVFTEKDGVMTMSQGAGQYPSLVVNMPIDFSGGVTFQAILKKNKTHDIVMPVSPTDASELARKIPWDGPFVRVCLDPNTGHPIVQSTPKGNGVDVKVLVDLPVIDWDNVAFQWAMYLKGDVVKLYQDGSKVLDSKHTGGFTKGYLSFGGSLAVDTTIDDVVIYTGDYDKDIINKAKAVSSAEKLFISWGKIKDQYR
ncbi:MAG: hypothetical protein QG588_1442 [Candidatus Poribacteria bacterium]|nr:hypothetical protein [Candidatus Poribacteria bacterium]